MAQGKLNVDFIGNLGKDPEISVIPTTGLKVCHFSIACSEKERDQEITTWVRVTAFDKLGEIAAQYLRKGSPVNVVGKLRIRDYTNREGVKVTEIGVTAREIHFLGSKKDAVEPQRTETAQTSGPAPSITDDDIPF